MYKKTLNDYFSDSFNATHRKFNLKFLGAEDQEKLVDMVMLRLNKGNPLDSENVEFQFNISRVPSIKNTQYYHVPLKEFSDFRSSLAFLVRN